MLALLGVFFFATILLGALTLDFSRLMSLKADVQTSADAGAHAGTSFLLRLPVDGCGILAAAQDTARTYALRNEAMQAIVTVEAVEAGVWDVATSTFTPIPSCNPAINAMHVVVSRQASGLLMSLVGVSAPVARAQAWARICRTSPPCPPAAQPVSAAGYLLSRIVLVTP